VEVSLPAFNVATINNWNVMNTEDYRVQMLKKRAGKAKLHSLRWGEK
jgi:hypothetical protein